jgi:2-iminobutanoate/2-iminopropanoate deaminase
VATGDFVFLGLHRGFGKDFITQLDSAFSYLKKSLTVLDTPLSNMIMVYVWFRDIKNVPAMEKRFMDYFEKGKYPTRTGGSTELIDDDCLFMMHGITCRKEVDMTQVKRITTNFSFSTAVGAGDYVFVGHHRGFGDGFTAQFDDMFSRLKKTLAEFGLTPENLTHVNVRLKNIKDLPEMEKRFNNYFKKDSFPARMTTTTNFIDNDCLLMIDGIAYRESHE